MGVDERDVDDALQARFDTKRMVWRDASDEAIEAAEKQHINRKVAAENLKRFFCFTKNNKIADNTADDGMTEQTSTKCAPPSFTESFEGMSTFLQTTLHSVSEPSLDEFVRRLLERVMVSVNYFHSNGGKRFVPRSSLPQQRQRQNDDDDDDYDDIDDDIPFSRRTTAKPARHTASSAQASQQQQASSQSSSHGPLLVEFKDCTSCRTTFPLRDHTQRSRFNLMLRRSVDGLPAELRARMLSDDLPSVQQLLESPPMQPCEKCQSRFVDYKMSMDAGVTVFFLELTFPGRQQHRSSLRLDGTDVKKQAATFHLQLSADGCIDFDDEQDTAANGNENDNENSNSAGSPLDPVVMVGDRNFRLRAFMKGSYSCGGVGAATRIDECGVAPSNTTSWSLLSRSAASEARDVSQLRALRRALTVSAPAVQQVQHDVPFLMLRFDLVDSAVPQATRGSANAMSFFDKYAYNDK